MEDRKLSKNKILAYAEFYDYLYSDENRIEKDILKEAKNVNGNGRLFDLLLKDKGILWWKGALRIKRFFVDWNSDEKEEILNEIKKSCNNPKITARNIGNGRYKGIHFPIASTVVYFFSQGNCPIMDRRAVQTLEEYGFNIKEDDWDKYFDTCKKITEDCGVTFRQLDKALWIYPDVCRHNVKNKNYLQICRKLTELNIAGKDLDEVKE